MRMLCGCVVVCSVLLSSFLGSAAWSQSGTSEPPGLDEIIAAANSYVQASPSWTPAEAPEGAGPESDEGGNREVFRLSPGMAFNRICHDVWFFTRSLFADRCYPVSAPEGVTL